ncbi:hypothetical protein HK098_007052 [Nowakowskiella sp. JEL0407]|nr:hypothetical protein HK098_007052 [Nowakowskiella sp. JEL0407]
MEKFIDRIGGPYSKSVNRQVGSRASLQVRNCQLEYNKSVNTMVVKYCAEGMKWATREEFESVKCPVLLIGGAEDKVTSSGTLCEIQKWVSHSSSYAPKPYILPGVGHQVMTENYRATNALIYRFLVDECKFNTMSNEYQILLVNDPKQKWNLKNFQKWLTIQDVTEKCIGPSVIHLLKFTYSEMVPKRLVYLSQLFRAMKVMKQDHELHSPRVFLQKHKEIGLIIDISKDPPPYDIDDVQAHGCEYMKVSTVSKAPPSLSDVNKFIDVAKAFWERKPDRQIAVHCHYGFNRTGFMICSYLIKELGVPISSAVEYFKIARPPGIRHEHFIYELELRYSDIEQAE